ncbi:MAG TPA: HAD family hydrolase, partial [Isosphaeraceae bacterium]|nr:HAD family hydrolase [Isosphaeraceae bacterium]
MARAIGGEPGRDETLPDLPRAILADILALARFRVFRHGTTLTTWEVAHELPGRVRLRHEGLRGNAALARRVERELATVHGVIDAQARPLTAGLLVHFDPGATSTRQLLQILEGLFHTPASATSPTAEGNSHHHPPVSFGLANASVGLAAVGEFAVPALLPASALLLVASNVKTFREAGRSLGKRRLDLPVLSTFIVVATLSTGQFLAAALMSWTIKFWHRRYRERVHETRHRLLSELTQHRRFARACVGDGLVELPVETLGPGDVIAVEEQELVAADGRVVGGEAMVDEASLRGGRGLSRKGLGDPIFAGSWVVAGAIRVEVAGHGHGTRAASLGRALMAASSTAPASFAVTSHGEDFAFRAVGPTLAVAGLGLLVGDATTAAAILRPDYATGPGMGVALRLLHDLAHAARQGVLIRDAAALRRFAEVDAVVFDDHPALRRPTLQVARIQASGAVVEDAILRYAATAYRELADERSRALLAECAARDVVPLDLDLPPLYLGPGIEFVHDGGPVHVREAFGIDAFGDAPEDCNWRGTGRSLEPGTPAPLLVSAAGRVVGMVLFERTARPEAASAFQQLRDGGLAVGLLSNRPESEVGQLALALGADFHHAGLSAESRADCLRACRVGGLKVAYVGDCRRNPEAAREAHVALSLAVELEDELDLKQE